MGAPGGGIAVALVWAVVEFARAFGRSRVGRAHVTLDERKLLSADEHEFRRTILAELSNVRTELANCQRQHTEGLLERDRMREKIEELEKGQP